MTLKTKELINQILRKQAGKHLNYNDVIHAIIEFCAERNIEEPKFNTIERMLRDMSSGGHKTISSDAEGYFWERLQDDKATPLIKWLPKSQKKVTKEVIQ